MERMDVADERNKVVPLYGLAHCPDRRITVANNIATPTSQAEKTRPLGLSGLA
jgi:hypothetical protein